MRKKIRGGFYFLKENSPCVANYTKPVYIYMITLDRILFVSVFMKNILRFCLHRHGMIIIHCWYNRLYKFQKNK